MPYPEGESSARLRSARDARARRSEQFSHGIETGPVSVVTISVSGVVSMAFAKTGFVLLCTMPSEASPPSNNDLVEMLKDDLAYLASQTRRAIVFELLSDIEAARMEPVLALRISLHRMHVHRLIALIRIKIKRLALHVENWWASVRDFHYKASSLAGASARVRSGGTVHHLVRLRVVRTMHRRMQAANFGFHKPSRRRTT